MPALRPVAKSTAAQACANQLRSAILGGEYAPGSRLPAERSLATMLGVTRVTLRTALTELAAHGLVEQVQGRGTTVLDFRRSASLELLSDLGRVTSDDPVAVARDLLAMRRSLARTVLEHLAEHRPDPTPVARAIQSFEQTAFAPGVSLDDLVAADLAIVAALLDAADSTVFSMCFHPVAHALSVHPALRAAMFRTPADNVLGWQALLAWLQAPEATVLPTILDLLHDRDVQTIATMESGR